MIKTLEGTAKYMTSTDYKERFLAEYWQLQIRCDKLKAMIEKWDNGKLDFTPTCPRSTYTWQLKAMEDYLQALKARANMEHIDL